MHPVALKKNNFQKEKGVPHALHGTFRADPRGWKKDRSPPQRAQAVHRIPHGKLQAGVPLPVSDETRRLSRDRGERRYEAGRAHDRHRRQHRPVPGRRARLHRRGIRKSHRRRALAHQERPLRLTAPRTATHHFPSDPTPGRPGRKTPDRPFTSFPIVRAPFGARSIANRDHKNV